LSDRLLGSEPESKASATHGGTIRGGTGKKIDRAGAIHRCLERRISRIISEVNRHRQSTITTRFPKGMPVDSWEGGWGLVFKTPE
jgi:hypothetical protein